ncbi:receptor activity-modifying protein 2-like isoform X2 [Carcharodon carcharias]|uniref:receptor activity-modifying protein 2-like isoform X2 n=1 Tax=Carcharodon carcharias TaxID=13397 RepID=UPI001B7E8952|nr:receptor activity-modifying protein 2-like isoform X2 [Carcharodon carcharias]
MEKDVFLLVQLLALAVWGNSLLTSSLSAKNNTNLHNQPQTSQSEGKTKRICNETLMLEVVHLCGYHFESQLNRMNSSDWCNFTLIAGYYDIFSECTESLTEKVDCFWPNPQVENYVSSAFQCLVQVQVKTTSAGNLINGSITANSPLNW